MSLETKNKIDDSKTPSTDINTAESVHHLSKLVNRRKKRNKFFNIAKNSIKIVAMTIVIIAVAFVVYKNWEFFTPSNFREVVVLNNESGSLTKIGGAVDVLTKGTAVYAAYEKGLAIATTKSIRYATVSGKDGFIVSCQFSKPSLYIAGKMVVVRALVAGLRLIISTPCGNPLREITEIPVFSAMTPMQVFNTVQIDRENEALKQINQLIIGGGSIDKTLNDILATYPNAIWSTYGMTETLSHIALRRLNGANASEWYTPLPNVSLSHSTEGTLIINAPDVAPQILETNDIVEFNSQNQFRIIGRKDNIINTGGIKVQIEQVEDLLKPLLKRPFMITAVPDSKFGERIVLLTEPNSLTEEKIKNAMKTLPIYWRAKEIITIDKLPQTGTGKPDRAKAKRLATEATNR